MPHHRVGIADTRSSVRPGRSADRMSIEPPCPGLPSSQPDRDWVDRTLTDSVATDLSSDILGGSDGSTVTGSEVTDSYSEHETDSNGSSLYDNATTTETDNLADGSTNDDVTADLSSAFETSGDTTDVTGNGITGAYSQHEADSDGSTVYDHATDTGTG